MTHDPCANSLGYFWLVYEFGSILLASQLLHFTRNPWTEWALCSWAPDFTYVFTCGPGDQTILSTVPTGIPTSNSTESSNNRQVLTTHQAALSGYHSIIIYYRTLVLTPDLYPHAQVAIHMLVWGWRFHWEPQCVKGMKLKCRKAIYRNNYIYTSLKMWLAIYHSQIIIYNYDNIKASTCTLTKVTQVSCFVQLFKGTSKCQPVSR